MKFFLVASVAYIAVVSSAFLPDDKNLDIVLVQNELVQLIRDDLNILWKIWKLNEPFFIPNIPDQHIEGKDISLDMDLKNVKISETDDYTINYTENNSRGSGVDFGLTVPKVHLQGQYKVRGVVRRSKINGAGNFTIDIDKIVVIGTIQLTNEKPYPKVKEIDANYDLEGLQCKVDGLTIEGMIMEQMMELVNTKIYEYIQSFKKDVRDVISRQLVQVINKNLEILNKMSDVYSQMVVSH
uniref:Putative juvenile hormone n=1 Tax=Panstrongylus lignarius TaxID=156445 RepID=A0A224XWE8_9HEMI